MDYFEEMTIRSLREYRELHELRIKELETLVNDMVISHAHVIGFIDDLKTSMKHVLERLHALEEKERERARDEHERDVR